MGQRSADTQRDQKSRKKAERCARAPSERCRPPSRGRRALSGRDPRALSGRDARALSGRDALITKYHSFVQDVVSRLIRTRKFPKALREEFVAAGYLGLVEAASRFDASRGHDFRAFAFLRIRGAIIDYVRASSEYSGASYRVVKTLEAVDDLRNEIADRPGRSAGSSKERAQQSLEFLSKSLIAFRLSALRHGGLRSTATPADQLEKQLDRKRNSERVREIVATLPDKERTIIEQYYFHDRKFTEVAQQWTGLSKSWVSRLHDRALSMLKERFELEAPELIRDS